MKSLKKCVALLLMMILAVSLVGCGKEGTPASASNTTKETVKQTEKEAGKSEKEVTNEVTTVQFWHAMGGGLGETLNTIVDEFNASHDDIVVEAVYQGNYNETLNKFKATAGTKESPALVQVYEIGTKYMSESGYITPMQDLIDADGYDLNTLEPSILSYYQLDGKLYSMPFNTSNAILFYNADAFKEAGLDPQNPPKTYSEIKEAAEKLTKVNGNTTERYGFSMLIHSWFFEQLMANKGANLLDGENGRSAEATKAIFNEADGVEVFTWLNDMYQAGHSTNYGGKWDDIRAAFRAGKVAMYMDSTAGTAANIKECDFEVGAANMPYPDGGEANGAIVGGASIWLSNSVTDEQQKAAWEFIKFMHSADQQAFWNVSTGYFPSNIGAYEKDLVKDNMVKYPQFQVAVDQLHDTKVQPATQGALMGVFPEAREAVQVAIEKMYNKELTPEEALTEAADKVTKAIDIYNKTMK